MANVLVRESSLQGIADAIRAKNGTQNTYKPDEMADAIEAISGGGITPTGTIEITQNGTHNVTNYASANVNVQTGSAPVINPLSITENGTYTAPTGVDGYSPITVNVSGGGSQQLTKLTEIPLSENSRSIAITPSSTWFNYDYLVVKYNLTLTSSDWIYFSKTNLSGGGYTQSLVSEYKDVGSAYKSSSKIVFMCPGTGTRTELSSGETMYVYTYTSSKYIVADSYISIYGGNKSDL